MISFWAIFVDFWGRELRLHSEVSDFKNVSVLSDFYALYHFVCHRNLVVSEKKSGFQKIWSQKICPGFHKVCLRKRSWFRYRKIWSQDKNVLASVKKILVIQWLKVNSRELATLFVQKEKIPSQMEVAPCCAWDWGTGMPLYRFFFSLVGPKND